MSQPRGSWIRLRNTTEAGDDNFYVEIVHISDLDYQLKNTDPVGDEFWIEAAQGAIRVERSKFIGDNAGIKSTYTPSSVVEPNADNPNPDPFQNLVYTPKPVIQPVVPFAETRLELGYDYGAVGGPSFSTEIVKVADERETKNSLSVLPLHRYQLGDRLVAESERDLLQEVSYLKQFHELRQGSYQGFRYKDWADFESIHQLIGIGDGTTTHWQLRKGYWVGDVVTWRPITKPVVGTVVLWANGIEQQPAVEPGGEGWTVNHETGVISNPEPLANGVVLTALFEFDVPVRFESDALGFSLQAYEADSGDAIYRLESVFVKEIRLPLSLPWEIQPAGEITEELDLGIVYDTVEQYSYATERQELRSGWGVAIPNRDESKLVLNLGDRVYDREEVDKLLAYFWKAKGKKKEFFLSHLNKEYIAKFNTDRLTIKFEVANNKDVLYILKGVKLQLSPNSLLDFLDKDTFLYIFIDASGSMDSSIPAINTALAQFKSLLVELVYGTVEVMNAKVVKYNFRDERYLKLFNDYYQEKAAYLIWVNEAYPAYHAGSFAPPTNNYRSDLSLFLNSYGNRKKFKAFIYSIVYDDPKFDEFQSHLTAAHQGTGGYSPALKNYQIKIKLSIPESTTANEYYSSLVK